MLKIIRFVAFCSVVLISSGCANQSLAPDINNKSLPSFTHLSEVPFFPQEPLLCGPAALATVIHSYDHQTLPETLTDSLWTPEVKGTFGVDMVSATRSRDMLAIQAPANLSDLLHLTSQGWPSIHLMNLGFKNLPQWHYAVLVGYDLESNEVLLRSGKVRIRKMSFKHFQRAKNLANNWSIVPVPVDNLPTLENWQQVYKELLSFTEVKPKLKHQVFSAGINAYPDKWQFLFAYANMMFEMKQFSESTTAYLTALNLSPHNPSIWNNLAYSQLEQGCFDSAVEAIQCAGKLSPEDDNVSHSIAEILSITPLDSNSQCLLAMQCPLDFGH